MSKARGKLVFNKCLRSSLHFRETWTVKTTAVIPLQRWYSIRAANIISTIPYNSTILQAHEMVNLIIFPHTPLQVCLLSYRQHLILLFIHCICVHVLTFVLFTFVRGCLLTELLAQGESVLPSDTLMNPDHQLYQWTLQKQLTCRARYATFHECWSEGSILVNWSQTHTYFPILCPSKRVSQIVASELHPALQSSVSEFLQKLINPPRMATVLSMSVVYQHVSFPKQRISTSFGYSDIQ
jgi:hypothetical protein